MNLVLFQGVLVLTFSLASTSDVKRQLGYTDIGSYHTFFDAHPTPFIAIARADTQAPPVTSVGLAKPATPPLQAIATAPLHDFNLQPVPHAVFLTPVAAEGVALDRGWHGFETAPLKFSPSYAHKALVPVHDAPFELAPVLQNYAIPKHLPLTNFGQNHIANNFNRHLNAPTPQFTAFHGDSKQFHNSYQVPSGYDGSIQHDSRPLVAQTTKPSNQASPPSGQGIISSPAPLLSSPIHDSQGPSQISDNGAEGHSSFGRDSGFQGSHHFSPSGPSSSQPTYDSSSHGHKSSSHGHGHGHHHTPKQHGHSSHKHHPSLTTSFGASGSGGSSSATHTPSSIHHTAPSGYGHSSISHSSPSHSTKGYTNSYSSGHSSSEHSGSSHSSHRPSSSHSGFGSTGLGSSSSGHSDSEHSSHKASSDHGGSSNSGEKATSFQSFVVHSYKAVPVYTKKSYYRHHEPSSDKQHYYSSYYGNSNEHHDDRSY